MDTYQHLSDVVFDINGIRCQHIHAPGALACTQAHIGRDANDNDALELFHSVHCSILIMSFVLCDLLDGDHIAAEACMCKQ